MSTEATHHVSVRVPAKLNLFLAVRGSRPDGYHEVVSVMHTVALYDHVTAELSGPRDLHPAARRHMEVVLEAVNGPAAGEVVPRGDDNLAVRAARLLAASAGGDPERDERPDRCPVTRLRLDKRIPVAAGMAGGSADAAGALLALNHLWGYDLGPGELRALAADLGADVPFCVEGGTALATGTGSATAQVLCRGSYDWVLGISSRPLSTADVYRTWDQVGAPSLALPDEVLHALRTGDREALGAALRNDLEVAAFHLRPELVDARRTLLDAGALGAVTAGSGPTIAALAEDANAAERLAAVASRCFDRVEVVRSPAGGPEVVPPLAATPEL